MTLALVPAGADFVKIKPCQFHHLGNGPELSEVSDLTNQAGGCCYTDPLMERMLPL